MLRFSTPVKGADVLRRLTVAPRIEFTVTDTSEVSDSWTINATLKPRTGYLVTLDSALTDTFGQRLLGYPVMAFGTTGYRPSVSYIQGRTMVERGGRRTLGITYVNVDTLEVQTIPVPDSLEGRFLSRSWYSWGDDWTTLAARATTRRIPLGAPRDRVSLYGLELPAPDASRPGTPTLFLVRGTRRRKEIAVRSALGAGRGAIVRMLVTEAVVVGLTASALAWFATIFTLDAIAPLVHEQLGRNAPRGLRARAWLGSLAENRPNRSRTSATTAGLNRLSCRSR